MMKKILAYLLLFPGAVYAQEQVEVLSLDACIRMALKNNLSVQQRKLDAENSRLDLVASRTVFLPQLSSSINAGNNWGRSIDPTTNQFIDSQNQSVSLTGTGQLVLFNGLARFWNLRRARFDAEANDYDLENARNNTILEVTTVYLEVLLNKELLENARYQLEISRQQLERSESMVAQGNAPRVEVLNMQAQVASNEVDLIRAENALDFSLVRLKQALLLEEDRQIDVEEQDIEVPAEDAATQVEVGEVYRNSLMNQPQVKSADLQVQSSQMAVRAAWGEVMPSLNMQFQLRSNYSSAQKERSAEEGSQRLENVDIGPLDIELGGQTITIDPSPGTLVLPTTRVITGETVAFGEQLDENLTYFLGVSMNIPIFQRWQVSTRIQKAEVRHQKAALGARQVRNTLRREVETAYNSYKAAFQLYQATQAKAAAIEESFRATENGYRLGTINYTDYQVGNNQLYQVRSELLRAKYTYFFRMKILDFYQGKLST